MSSPIKTFVFRFRDGLVFLLPLAIVSGVLSIFFAAGPVNDFVQGQLGKPQNFNFPVAVDFDKNDNLYVIDSASRRVSSFTSDGNERWTLTGAKRSGGFYESYRLAAKPAGGVVVYNAVLDPADDSLEAEELLSFSDDGTLEGTLVRIFYPKEQRAFDDEHIGTFQVYEDKAHGVLVRYLLREHGKLVLHERSATVGGDTSPDSHAVVFSAPLPENLVVEKAVPHLPEGLLLTEITGKVYVLDARGTLTEPAFTRKAALQKPWELRVAPDGAIYLLDLAGCAVWKADNLQAPDLKLVFDGSDVLKTGRNNPSFESIALGAAGTVGIVDKFNHTIFMKTADDQTAAVSGGPKPDLELWAERLWIVVAALFVFCTGWSLVGLLRRLLATRTSIILKQVAVILPLVIISAIVGSWNIYALLEKQYQNAIRNKLTFIASMGETSVDGSLVAAINRASDVGQAAHVKLTQQAKDLLNSRSDSWNQALHTVIYKYHDDKFYFLVSGSPNFGVMYPYGGASREHFAAARSGKVQFTRYSDEYGSYLSALAPLTAADGSVAGVLEIYLNQSTLDELSNAYNQNLIVGIVFSVLLVLLLLIVSDIVLFLALNYLQKAAEKVTGGELGITVKVRHHDEIGDLALDFNTMSTRLKDYFGRLKDIRDANARFVPSEFLDFFGKASLADVDSGDQIRQQVTLFFADIRSFTQLSEGMTPKENFDFINSYLSVMGPVIRRNNGFIEHYLGDAIMAIFPQKPEDAVRAGLEMREILVGFNRTREDEGRAPIAFGVGVHCEEIILGVVGERSRLAATVVSDAVDLVNRLESATKEHHVGLVMTESVWSSLPEDLKGRSNAVGTIDYDDENLPLYGL